MKPIYRNSSEGKMNHVKYNPRKGEVITQHKEMNRSKGVSSAKYSKKIKHKKAMKRRLNLKTPRVESTDPIHNFIQKSTRKRKQSSQSGMRSLDEFTEGGYNRITNLASSENIRKFKEVPSQSFVALNINDKIPDVHIPSQYNVKSDLTANNLTSVRTLKEFKKSSQFGQNKKSISVQNKESLIRNEGKTTINLISILNKSNNNSLSINIKDETNDNGVFPQKVKFYRDFDNPDLTFFPEIKQTLERNATKIKTRNLDAKVSAGSDNFIPRRVQKVQNHQRREKDAKYFEGSQTPGRSLLNKQSTITSKDLSVDVSNTLWNREKPSEAIREGINLKDQEPSPKDFLKPNKQENRPGTSFDSSKRSTDGNMAQYSYSSQASDFKSQKEESKEESIEINKEKMHEIHQKKSPIKLFSCFQAVEQRSDDTLTFRSERDDIEAAVCELVAERAFAQKMRIFSYFKTYIGSPILLKLCMVFRSKVQMKLKSQVFHVLKNNLIQQKRLKLKAIGTKRKEELEKLQEKVAKLEAQNKLISNSRFKKRKKKSPDREKEVIKEKPKIPKEAVVNQPTLVRLGIKKMISTILNSNILTKSEQKRTSSLAPQNFMRLCNIFEGTKSEDLNNLLKASETLIVEHDGISHKQDNNFVMRWAIYVIKTGLTKLKYKYELIQSENSKINIAKQTERERRMIENGYNIRRKKVKQPLETSFENINDISKLINRLEEFRYKNLNTLNCSICHVLFILYCCKVKKCSLPEHKRSTDPGLLITLEDITLIMNTKEHHNTQFNYKSVGPDDLIDLKTCFISLQSYEEDAEKLNEYSKNLYYLLLKLCVQNPKCAISEELEEPDISLNSQINQFIYSNTLVKVFPRYFFPYLL
ncbi:unnamed protein product [Moneuplotes crassus]|uniref:Uncharacterized protein n=1 Tax=Euplotes crassus TaxID=5936 RepID=A0AAD1YAL7_EUPCR|nr:unnamed protein product [Moneuplotes crassus]